MADTVTCVLTTHTTLFEIVNDLPSSSKYQLKIHLTASVPWIINMLFIKFKIRTTSLLSALYVRIGILSYVEILASPCLGGFFFFFFFFL